MVLFWFSHDEMPAEILWISFWSTVVPLNRLTRGLCAALRRSAGKRCKWQPLWNTREISTTPNRLCPFRPSASCSDLFPDVGARALACCSESFIAKKAHPYNAQQVLVAAFMEKAHKLHNAKQIFWLFSHRGRLTRIVENTRSGLNQDPNKRISGRGYRKPLR